MKNIWGEGTTRHGIKKGLAAYPGEPAINKETEEERIIYQALTNEEMNQLALKLKDMHIQGKDFRNTYEYYQLMRPFFGHLGWDAGGNEKSNLSKFITDKIWFQLPDETVFTDQLWKNLEYAIITYDGSQGDFLNHAWITAKRLKQKQINDTKKNQKKDGKSEESKLKFINMTFVDENDEVKEIDQEDDRDLLGQVESDIDVQILIEELAEGFRQKDKAKFVLKHLVAGVKKADIARLMVEEFGGKETSHAQFCSRLLKRVEDMLAKSHKFNTTYVPKPPKGNSKEAKAKRKAYKKHREKYAAKFFDPEAVEKNRIRKRKYAQFTAAGVVEVYHWTKEQIQEYFNRGKN